MTADHRLFDKQVEYFEGKYNIIVWDAPVIGVASIEDACMVAKKLKADGIDCIELCGAFGEAGEFVKLTAHSTQVCIIVTI